MNNRKLCIMGFVILVSFVGGCSKNEDWEKNVISETVKIEGLTKDYDFLFLTDTHMVVQDEQDTKKVQDFSEIRFDDFQNEEDVCSAEQFDEWIKHVNEKQWDGLLLGGDIIDYPSIANVEHLENNLEDLKVPYLYALGNHDWTFPWEYMTQKGEELYLPMLEPYMQKDSSIHNLDFGEFIVVAVDNSANQIQPEAMEEYKQILSGGRPVILMLHIPLLTQSVLTKAKREWNGAVVLGGGNYGGIYPDETSQEFIDLTTAQDSPVVLVLAGHVHFTDKDMINDKILQLVGDAGYKGSALHLHLQGK